MKFERILITLTVILAFFVRIIAINNFPPSLNWDEVSHGYNAYSVLKTGRDEWGNLFPLIFRAYGDYKLPIYIYFTVPFIGLFGLNPLSVRLVSIIAGTLIPLVVYFILKTILPKKPFIALFAAMIVAFMPGTIFLSRIAVEANLFLLFFCLSMLYIFKKDYGTSGIFYGLGLLTYNSSRVLLPFYLGLITVLAIKNHYNLKRNILKFVIFFAALFVVANQTLNESGQARYKWVSILDQGAINRINELRQKYPRFVVNKYSYFVYSAASNYLSHFNPKFLFFTGGSNYQFNIPEFYLISPLLAPFFLFGLVEIFLQIKNKKNINYLILLFWLLIAPIPSAITRDAPHTLRSLTILPIVAIIIALGFARLNKKYFKLALFYFLLVVIFTQYAFWGKYKAYAVNSSDVWQYGYKEIVDFTKENYDQYDQIIITKKYGEAHEFLLFYWPWNPESYQNDSFKIWDYHADWYWINGFNKFKFVNDWEIKDITKNINTNEHILLISSPNNYNQNNAKLIKTIYFLDGKPAFDILNLYAEKQ
jgi:4-amino-4-deoxy-L-arabinose transferase-like glycosyltransferase